MKTALGFEDSFGSDMIAYMQHPQVRFSVLVGHDGELIGSTTGAGVDAEAVGVWILGIFMNVENTVRRLGNERVYQIVLTTSDDALFIADLGDSLIAQSINSSDTNAIEQLIERASNIIADREHNELAYTNRLLP